jgi:hypothetical protein
MKIHSKSAALREVAEFLAGQAFAVDVKTVTLTMNFPGLLMYFAPSDGHRANEYIQRNNSLVLVSRECC